MLRRIGRRKRVLALPARLAGLIEYAFVQTKMFKDPRAAILHLGIFWGFILLTVGTANIVTGGLLLLDAGLLGAELFLTRVSLVVALDAALEMPDPRALPVTVSPGGDRVAQQMKLDRVRLLQSSR
mgnify:CR=1 FL=1